MKILVTGIAGFIGSHCAERLLAMGHSVYGIDNFSDYYDINLKTKNADAVIAKGGKIITLDLRDTSSIKDLDTDFDYIFHFAAQPGLSKTATYQDYYANNVIGTEHLIDFAKKNEQLKLFVNIATSSIYGLEATFSEDVTPKPASDYGVTKHKAEQLVLEQSEASIFKACSLRLYSVIGPRERPEKMYTKLIDLGLKGEPFPLFEGSEKHLRSFTYVGDIIDGIVSVIGKETTVNNEIINLGTEAEYTTQQGIEAVERVIGKSITLKIKPKRKGDQLRTRANINKARKLLGYNPQTTLLQSVEAQVNWYKENCI
ncbi:MAG: NAD-dependent epimerase/dehydratase family protein [Winogradskyella sp.]|uniref:NAD-dependent epimerase/dehydratase family protein n=1 Tax=Winogradskyella sp. TaxID=1883156 RepID=UPI000F417E94|nr:NAD-dependent epimerase/dehydratase family protein [Winogradskyella sp.]RNC86848.1 MAG: NAD-dependent epimerase/dehydratase family protein [Winogradskyella sp.]